MNKVKAFNKYRQIMLDRNTIKLAINIGQHKLKYIDKDDAEYTIASSVNKHLSTREGNNMVSANKGIAINPDYIDITQPFNPFIIYVSGYEDGIKVKEALARQVKKLAKKKKNPNWRQFFFKKGRRVF